MGKKAWKEICLYKSDDEGYSGQMKQYHRIFTKQFRKDVRRLEKSGFDLRKLETVITSLAEGKKLEDKYRDHSLRGALRNTRECHIGPDWLLHYAINDDELILFLISTGDHRHVLDME